MEIEDWNYGMVESWQAKIVDRWNIPGFGCQI